MKTQLAHRTITLLIGVAVALIVGFTLMYSHHTETSSRNSTEPAAPGIASFLSYKNFQEIVIERLF